MASESIGERDTSERDVAAAAGKSERERLVGRAGIVGAGTLVSRVLGFVRDVTIAALFTRAQTDAFAVALTIPNTLRQLLAEGAVSSAVTSRRDSGVPRSSATATPRRSWSPDALEKIAANTRNTSTGSTKLIASAPRSPDSARTCARHTAHVIGCLR